MTATELLKMRLLQLMNAPGEPRRRSRSPLSIAMNCLPSPTEYQPALGNSASSGSNSLYAESGRCGMPESVMDFHLHVKGRRKSPVRSVG